MSAQDSPGVRALLGAAGLGMLFATGLILGLSRGRVEDMTIGDGIIYRYVATHLTGSEEDLAQFLGPRGTSIRYGRIGLPVLLWVTSAGHGDVVPYTQPLIMILSAGGIASATRALFGKGGSLLSLAPFVAIGTTASLAGGFAEAPAVALSLWAIVTAVRGRIAASIALFAAAILTKEMAVVPLVGTMIWLTLHSRRRPAAALALAVLPVAAWYGFVASRYGHLPPLDPWLRQVGGTDLPFVAAWRSMTELPAASVAVAAAHAVASGAMILLLRRSVFALIGAVGALQLSVTGPYVWRFIGDGIRQAAFIETAVVLATLGLLAPKAAAPGTTARTVPEGEAAGGG